MTKISRVFPNILSDKLPESRDFYTELLGFQVAYDSDWFIYLWAPQSSLNELGIWRRDHELVPAEYQNVPQGMFLIFAVDDCDAVYARAVEKQIAIVRPPKDLFYGQRSFLARDPNGLLIDVSAPVRASSESLASNGLEPSGRTREGESSAKTRTSLRFRKSCDLCTGKLSG